MTFIKSLIHFERDDVHLVISAETTPIDYSDDVQSDDHRDTPTPFSGTSTQAAASVLQHDLGAWYTSVDHGLDLTGHLLALQYTSSGLFNVEGNFSVESARFHGSLSNLGFKKYRPDLKADFSVGVQNISSSSQSISLYGVALQSDTQLTQAQSGTGGAVIEGFVDVPGRLLIRSAAVLLKEVSISAGLFSIPIASLSGVPSSSGEYSLTLLDDAGTVVRTWNVFVPIQGSLLRAGESSWTVFAGQINEVSTSRFLPFSGFSNLGIGGTYRHGFSADVTGEWLTSLEQRGARSGASVGYVPASWISLNASVSKLWSQLEAGQATQNLGVDLHQGTVGVGASVINTVCLNAPTLPKAAGNCKNARVNARVGTESLGTFSFIKNQSFGGLTKTASDGFSWDLPSLRRATLSVYGTRQTDPMHRSYSVGVILTIPFGMGSTRTGYNQAGSDTASLSTNYASAKDRDLAYTVGTQGQESSFGHTGQVQGSVQYTPWFGSYSGSAQIDSRGNGTLGLSESGGWVWAEGQRLVVKPGSNSLAVIHAPGLSEISIAANDGQRQAVTNQDGYAAVFTDPGSNAEFKLAPSQLADDVKVADSIVGHTPLPWTATVWTPDVRHVNRGWIKLTLPSGTPIPLGSMLSIPGSPPYVVLDGGEVFVEELPLNTTQGQIALPGNTGRCLLKFGPLLTLQAYADPLMKTFICNSPLGNKPAL